MLVSRSQRNGWISMEDPSGIEVNILKCLPPVSYLYIVCLFTSKSAVCLHFLSVYFHIPLAVYLLDFLMLKLLKYVMFVVKLTNEEDDDDDDES